MGDEKGEEVLSRKRIAKDGPETGYPTGFKRMV